MIFLLELTFYKQGSQRFLQNDKIDFKGLLLYIFTKVNPDTFN